MPGAPSSLTYGLVSPQEVDAQKDEYARSLDQQQQQAREALVQQCDRQREYLRVQAEQQKAIAAGRWDQRFREQEMAAEQEYQQELARVREAARQLKVALEYQAAALVVEYNARKSQEELNYRIYEAEIREWEEFQRMSPGQIQNAEERLQAQLAYARDRDSASWRRLDELPELPVDRWVPEGLGAAGANFGGVASGYSVFNQTSFSAIGGPPTHGATVGYAAAHAMASAALATSNASPYPLAQPASAAQFGSVRGPHSSAVY